VKHQATTAAAEQLQQYTLALTLFAVGSMRALKQQLAVAKRQTEALHATVFQIINPCVLLQRA
jgi:hypothetical protein